jgi:hypothetical protein
MTAKQATMTAHIVDKYGIPGQATVTVSADDTKTIAQLLSDLSTYSGDISTLTQGIVVKESVLLEVPTGNDPTAAAGDIEKGALFNFGNALTTFKTGIYVPDVSPAILNANGLVDLTNANVTNFVTFVTTAHTVITVVTKGLQALNRLVDVLLSFRKHRKPLSRKTTEL